MRYNNHSKVFYWWFWILIIMYLVAGIVAGFIFKGHTPATTSSYDYTYTEPQDRFNGLLMFGVWLSGVIPAAIIYAVYAHLENQEIQIDLLAELYNGVQKISTDKCENSDHDNKHNIGVTRQSTWVCSRCGTTNQPYEERCTNCDYKRN